MFKHNYIQKLAFDNVTKQRKLYRFIFVSLILTFALSTGMSILFSSYEDIGFREKCSRYGLWSVSFHDLPDDKLQVLKSDQDMQIGHIYNVGALSYQGRQKGNLQSLDSDAIDLTNLTLLQGEFPHNQNEIALEENQLMILDIPQKINQSIDLTITVNNKDIVQHYKIVGILKDYSRSYPLSLSPFLTTGNTSGERMTLINANDNLRLWNDIIDNDLELDAHFNQQTYDNYAQKEEGRFSLSQTYETVLKNIIVCFGFVGVLGTMVSSMKKRTENLTLMRAVGATPLQLLKLIMYESLFIMLVAGVIGFVIGITMSFILLFAYQYIMNSEFVYIINNTFYMQIIFTIIASLVAVVIPSLSTYSIPLITRINQKVKGTRKKKSRKLNSLSFALQEIRMNRFVSFLLVLIILAGIFAGDLLSLSIESYYSSLDDTLEDDYDYKIYENSQFSDIDVSSLTKNDGVTSQEVYNQKVSMYWDEIESEESLKSQRISNELNGNISVFPYVEKANITSYYNEKLFQDVLSQHTIEGKFPNHNNEVLIFKPWMSASPNGRGQSDEKKNDEDYIHDIGLEVGDEVEVVTLNEGEIENQNIIKLKIVGVLEINKLSKKERALLSEGNTNGYNLIVNQATYNQYKTKDQQKTLLFTVNNEEGIAPFKKSVYNLLNRYENIYYEDVYADRQLRKITSQELVWKDASFFGVLFIGTVVLTYLHRKVKILGQKHEIGLYRAIGMTNQQIYKIHFLYAAILYFGTSLCYLGYSVFMYSSVGANIQEIIDIYFGTMRIPSIVIIGVGFIAAIMIPVYTQLKEKILDNISK